MRVLCPRCRKYFEYAGGEKATDLACPECGSSFPGDAEETQIHVPVERSGRFGRLELLKIIGAGAFGTVFMARDKELDRIVAVKIPRLGSVCSRDDLRRFQREARAAAQLNHPGIVAVHDVGTTDESGQQDPQEEIPYIVSEFVEGITLSDLLTSRRATFRESAELIASVADALAHAHENGVIHRDVKPSNIMLERIACLDGTRHQVAENDVSSIQLREMKVRLMDFGLAKHQSGEITMTLDGQIMGTPAYMSPEQALGKTSEVGGPSDIYSLGVVLYQMLTGELPFRGTARMLFHQVLHEDPRPPRSLDRGIPRDLDTICLKAMEKLPARRYSIAQELASDLRHFLNGEATKARPMSILERCWRRCRRNPGPVAALFGVVCAVIIAVLLLAIRAQGNVEEMPEGANQLSVLPHLLRAGGIPVVAIASTGMGLTLSVAINLCLSNNRRVFLVHVVLSMIPIILALVGTLYGYSLFLRLATSPASPKPFEIAIAMASTAAFAIIGIVPAVCAAILGLAGLTLKSGAANE